MSIKKINKSFKFFAFGLASLFVFFLGIFLSKKQDIPYMSIGNYGEGEGIVHADVPATAPVIIPSGGGDSSDGNDGSDGC
jgi:hypothetical protein